MRSQPRRILPLTEIHPSVLSGSGRCSIIKALTDCRRYRYGLDTNSALLLLQNKACCTLFAPRSPTTTCIVASLSSQPEARAIDLWRGAPGPADAKSTPRTYICCGQDGLRRHFDEYLLSRFWHCSSR
ncbi:hypothetical protein Zmor_015348 [Zophobas morio]|uniref:Uncharacterized protein n=1 Tax=Zophobas morio TaxID=2755281 RepID=A0AA38MHN7_9CUCU|nr:hypothetical protein Zmor_015348 [Zophobas morio]